MKRKTLSSLLKQEMPEQIMLLEKGSYYHLHFKDRVEYWELGSTQPRMVHFFRKRKESIPQKT